MTTLESTDLDQARQYFNHTRGRVLAVTAGLSEAQWRFKPSPECWSIAENLEHMIIVRERILGPIRERLAQAPAPPLDRDNQAIDAIVLRKIPDRSIKAKGPDVIHPTGQWTPSEALDR